MNTIQNIINEIKALRGANVKIFGQNTTLRDNVGEFEIDVCDFLSELEGLEVELIQENYNEELDEYEEVKMDSIEEYLGYLEGNFGLKEIQDGNTYNWSAPINHHFNFRIYECLDTYYMVLSVHKYGDVRCNYTQDVLLKFDGEWELQEKFYENENSYKSIYVDVDGVNYDVSVNLWSDGKEVCSEGGTYICETYEDDEQEIIEDIRKKIK